ncbi:MAG: class I tRNA ligase family protein [Candidatus Doudnabacteria bacterium]|nr:class I tRNA ligase family protein [Candidatus Doudnabacteria bacterium]
MNKSFKPLDPKPDFPKLEEEILKFWEENQIFLKTLEKTKDGTPYTFYDGPPFATGLPHYGHILASTVKDLFPRYQTMNGRFVRRRWGWDCHGLPIEEIVERKLGISGKKDIEKMGIKKFNETCRSMVLQFADEWKKTITRVARWTEFDDSYKTMDRDYMESVWWAFKQIYDKGLIYEGRRVLLYCPRCETPISNFEVAMDNSYKEVTEEAVTVKFKVKGQENTYLLAWTTTPWTLPGNVALAVGEDIDYIKTEKDGEVFILAKERAGNMKVLDSSKIKGKDLVGLEYEPLFDVPAVASDKAFKVYAADFVTTEEGTGIVHTAVVYGEDDYNLGLKVGLPVVPLLDEKGIFNDKAPELVRGIYFKDSEKLIKKDLETRGLMFERKQHQHSYPHCWRCGTTLFYNAIPAWFMNIQKIKSGLLKTNDKEVNWYPEHLKHGRYQKSVEAAPDWNISRNRYWGNPIPIWKCEDSHNTVVGSIRDLGLEKNTFYFTRHGQAENNVLQLNSCWPETKPYHLTKEGKAQVKTAAQKLKAEGIDLIFSSDITRDKETAEFIAKELGIEATFDERLREVNVAEYNGKTYAEYNQAFSFAERWDQAPAGGETNREVEKRMLDFVREINQKYQDKKILVVSHGDPLWLLIKHFGSERPYPNYADVFLMNISIADLHRPYIDEVVVKCQECGKDAKRVTEIFDSWVEAGSMPFAEYHYPFDQKEIFESRFPGQFVAEYIAQTRAWFYVMHVISYNLFGKAPFENVVTTGTILAEDGSKMSKSKNNYPDPWEVINKYGVDAMRFYLMNSPVMSADNLNFSERELGVTYRKNILILWNVYNYFVTYANEAGWEPTLKERPKLTNVLDQWIVAKTQELVNQVTENLDGYNTVKATRAIEAYINELSTWYLRRSRGRKDAHFFGTMRHALLMLSKVMAPVAPYISELIYQNLNRNTEVLSVHLADWPKKEKLADEQKTLLEQMALVRTLVEQGHGVRKAANIKLRQPLALATYSGKQLAKEFEEILADELNVKSVKPGEKLEFDLNITPELKNEGLARELERLVQDLRKTTGLKVGEITNLSYNTTDDELIAAFELFDTKKTYINKISQEAGGEKFEIDGKSVDIALKS